MNNHKSRASHRASFTSFLRCRSSRSLHRALLCAVLTLAASLAIASPSSAASFGIETFEVEATGPAAEPVVQAGSHPFSLTTNINFTHHEFENEFGEVFLIPEKDPKDIEVNLPQGFVVNPNATATRCTGAEIVQEGGCPNSSAVGIVVARTSFFPQAPSPIFNMVPPPGAPAELAFNLGGTGAVVNLVGGVRTGGDYGLSAEVTGITQKLSVDGATVTLWGDPSAESHDKQRGNCDYFSGKGKVAEEEEEREREINEKGSTNPNRTFFCAVPRTKTPFLTMPSACSGAVFGTARADSWQEPGAFTPVTASTVGIGPVTGCSRLGFQPSVEVAPQPAAAAPEQPIGLDVDVKIPQEESIAGLAEANLKQAVVSLPAGVAISPSAANGLSACSEEQIALHSSTSGHCPAASKIGSAEVITPLLRQPLKGAVYLAQQERNPFGSLLAMYLVVEGSGVVVKLAGHVEADPVTGQLTTTFDNNPELPFSDLKVSIFGGARAPLISPSSCGTYTSTTGLTPWSATPTVTATSAFSVTGGCTSSFKPAVTAGTSANQAGGSGAFSTTISRGDGERRLNRISERLPVGLIGDLKGVPRCAEAQANAGTCPSTTLIGHVSTAAGPGADPVYVGGNVFLTEPYAGAPFGLSIVVHAAAGPFDLGIVVVRAKIEVDRHTAAVSVLSDPLPTILKGIPLDVRSVQVNVDRAGFIRNPTGCKHLTIGSEIESTDGAHSNGSVPFQAANCERLGFAPKLTVRSQARISRSDGAYLEVRVTTHSGQSNIAKVHTQIPRQLPSRLTTLQKACRERVFNANPSSCPAESVIGQASAVTPILNQSLQGPVYIVSHAGASFPDVVAVLQGEGITYELVGNTDIKHGITYSTFNAVPDVPVSMFDLVLPRGPHSIFGAIATPCGQKLRIPTTLTSQSGKQTFEQAPIGVNGCHKKQAKKRKKS